MVYKYLQNTKYDLFLIYLYILPFALISIPRKMYGREYQDWGNILDHTNLLVRSINICDDSIY